MTEYAQQCIAMQCSPLSALENAFSTAEEDGELKLDSLHAIPDPHFNIFLRSLGSLSRLRAVRMCGAFEATTAEFFALSDALSFSGIALQELRMNCNFLGAPVAIALFEMVSKGIELLQLSHFRHLSHFLACFSDVGQPLLLRHLELQESVAEGNFDKLALLCQSVPLRFLGMQRARFLNRGLSVMDFVRLLSNIATGTETSQDLPVVDITETMLPPLALALLKSLDSTGVRVQVVHNEKTYTGDMGKAPIRRAPQTPMLDSGSSDIMNRVLTVEDLI